MSRVRTGHRPSDWLDIGPAGPSAFARRTIGGAMVTGHRSPGPSPVLPKTPTTAEERRTIAEAWNGGKAA